MPPAHLPPADARNSLRVLFVSHTFPPAERDLASVGGMQRVATDLCAALEIHPGVHMSSCVLRSSWRWIYVKTPPYLARTYLTISSLIQAGEVDVVLFSSMVTACLAVPLRHLLLRHGVRAVAIAHGLDVTWAMPPYTAALRHVFCSLDAVAAVSRATGQACLDRDLAPDRLHVIPNGIRVNRFASPPPVDRRRDLGDGVDSRPLPPDSFLLCSVGRQVPRKGFAWFVDTVMPTLPCNVHYWLAGTGPEGPNIRAAATRRAVGDRVRLLGQVSEDFLGQLYRGSDLFIMPNVPMPGTMEGFGVVMLEAGLCGLPTIASRLEGIQDVISESENGHLVESGSPAAFRAAIMRYHGSRASLEAARERAVKRTRHFSWPVIADSYVGLMRGLCEGAGPAVLRRATEYTAPPADAATRQAPASA